MEPTTLAANMLAAYAPVSVQNSHLEESVRLVTSNYRHLKPQVAQLTEGERPEWESMLAIHSCFEEGVILLKQAENLTAPALPRPISPTSLAANEQQFSIIKRLQNVRDRILNLKTDHAPDIQKIESQGIHNAAIQNLLNEQQRVFNRILEALRLRLNEPPPAPASTAAAEESNSAQPNSFEKVWSHPAFCKPIAIAGDGMEVAKQVLTERQGNPARLFRLKLSAVVLKLFYSIPDTVCAIIQIVKQLKDSGTQRKELKAGRIQLAQLQTRIGNIQQELIHQRIADQSTPSYWSERLGQERDALILEEQALKTKLDAIRKELRSAPLGISLGIFGTLGNLAEISANALEVVNIFFEAGFYISEKVIASIGTAIQFLAPIAGGIQVLLGGGMLVSQGKKMHDLNRANQKLKQQIAEAEAKMNPGRLQLKREIEAIKVQLMNKNLAEADRQTLKGDLDRKIEELNAIVPSDLVENFNELEVNRLNIELLKNNRKLGLMGLGIANSTLLTVGGIIGLASALTTLAFPVSIALAGISLGILLISLILSVVRMVRRKRSAQTLKLEQRPLQLQSQEFSQKTETLVTQFKDTNLSAEKRAERLRIWDLLCAQDPRLATLVGAKVGVQDPKIIEEAFASHFSGIAVA